MIAADVGVVARVENATPLLLVQVMTNSDVVQSPDRTGK
jgi:hypothetical protein